MSDLRAFKPIADLISRLGLSMSELGMTGRSALSRRQTNSLQSWLRCFVRFAGCGETMRIIAFITFSADIPRILEHIGVDSVAPRITPARGPPLWDDCGAQEPWEGVDAMPDGIWQTNHHPTTPKISVPFGECLVVGGC